MMGRTDYGHDRDAAIISRLIARAQVDYDKAKAASDAALSVTQHAARYLDDLKRRFAHAEHRAK